MAEKASGGSCMGVLLLLLRTIRRIGTVSPAEGSHGRKLVRLKVQRKFDSRPSTRELTVQKVNPSSVEQSTCVFEY